MPSPPVQLFLTTIASQPALRHKQEYITRTLQIKKIPYTAHDLASDEAAKKLWRRKAPPDKQQLPGILVGGKFPGTFTEFEEAVEYDELDIFLRLKESWDEDIDGDRPAPPAQPIGVPGAIAHSQMTPEHHKPKIFAESDSPLGKKKTPVNKRAGEFDVSGELSGFGLQGVMATEDDLNDLVAELGLGGDDASELVKGLSAGPSKAKAAPAAEKPKTEEPKPQATTAEPEAPAVPDLKEIEPAKPTEASEMPKAEESATEQAALAAEPVAPPEIASKGQTSGDATDEQKSTDAAALVATAPEAKAEDTSKAEDKDSA